MKPFRMMIFVAIALLTLSACAGSETPPELSSTEPVVTVNPSGIAPLSAMVSFETTNPAIVEVIVIGVDGKRSDIHRLISESGTEHEIEVIGLYPPSVYEPLGMEGNEVVLNIMDLHGRQLVKTLTIATDPLVADLPEVSILTPMAPKSKPVLHMVDLLRVPPGRPISPYTIIFDNFGRVRWALDLSNFVGWAMPIRLNDSGTITVPYQNGLYEYDMLGNLLGAVFIDPAYTLHHEMRLLPNGDYLLSVDDGNIPTDEDLIVQVDGITGEMVRSWDMRQVLDVDRQDYVNNPVDWFHNNAVVIDPADNSLVISGRNQGVIKVTQQNELKWIMAPHTGWGLAGPDGTGFDTTSFLLDPVDATGVPYAPEVIDGLARTADFDWSWGQHAPLIMENGHILLFDNGFRPQFGAGISNSRAVEYAIDEANMTVTQVWQWGEERGSDYFSSIVGDVDIMPETGNILITAGALGNGDPTRDDRALVTEITYPGGEVVFEAEINFVDLPSGALSAVAYRTERIELPN